MAMYWDTLRSETKIIDGIEIGRYSYAYKESSSSCNYPGGSGRRVSLAESHATNALYKNRHVRRFIFADSFKTAAEEKGYFVFQIDRDPPSVLHRYPARCGQYRLPRKGKWTIRSAAHRTEDGGMIKKVLNLFAPTFKVYGYYLWDGEERLMLTIRDSELRTEALVLNRLGWIDSFVPTRIERI